MTGIPNTASALAELRQTIAARHRAIALGTAQPEAMARLQHLERAMEIVLLASRIHYFEADDEIKAR